MTESSKERIAWVDGVRALGVVLVVLNHASVPLFWTPQFKGGSGWVCAVWTHAGTVSCVHLFFLLAGYLAFRKPDTPSARGIAARTLRLAAPFLVYTALYAAHDHWIEGAPFPPLLSYLFVPACYHLWFFAPMLLIGLLSALVRPTDNHRLGLPLALGLLLLANAHSLRVHGLPGPLDHELSLLGSFNQIGVLLSWFLLTVVGYHLGSLSPSRTVVIGALLGVLGLTGWIAWATLVGTTWSVGSAAAAVPHVHPELGWLDDLNWAVVLHAVCLFVVARAVAPWVLRFGVTRRVFGALSARSLGIYGLHVLVLVRLERAGTLPWLHASPWVALPVVTLLALAVAWGTARLVALMDRRGAVV